MVTKDEVMRALGGVMGPDGASLATSGALSDVLISEGRVTFSITGNPARSKELETVRLAAERAVKGLEGVETVLVTLTAERSPQGTRSLGRASPRRGPSGRATPEPDARAGAHRRRRSRHRDCERQRGRR